MFGRGRNGPQSDWSNDYLTGGEGSYPGDWQSDDLADFGLNPRDWRQIEGLLHQAGNPEPADPRPDPLALSLAVSSLARSMAGKEYVPASALTNGLLDLWAALAPGGRRATRPVEKLLTALAHRHLVATSEVDSLLDDVRTDMAVEA